MSRVSPSMVMFWMRCLMSGPMVDGSSFEGSFFWPWFLGFFGGGFVFAV